MLSVSVYASGQEFALANIPDSLKDNARAVFHLNELHFKIISLNKTVLHRRQVVTVLTPKGSGFGAAAVNYDKSASIISFKANLYDRSGELVRKLKKSEFHDVSNISNVSLFEDNRVKVADLRKKTYPYTVEFEYEVEYNSLFFTPGFVAQPGENVGVVKAIYQITGPSGLIPHYKLYNTGVPESRPANDGVSLTWTFENLTPFQFEPYGSDIQVYTPTIETTPRKFEYDGYAGEFNGWKSFGQWIASLNEGRDELTDESRQKITQLVAGIDDEREKIKVIYKYLQEHTRYVSVQLGIGGYQPIEAGKVEKMGYGDCKALSNYTKAMLKAAGIESHYVLVEAGSFPRPLHRDFANNTFNHAILAVPAGKDTVWLECTSQTNPFGYLGKFTSDREVLLIREGEGVVVRTPEYVPEDNKQLTTAVVTIDSLGNAIADVRTRYTGIQFENGNLDYYLRQSEEEQKKWIYKNFDSPSFNIRAFNFDYQESSIPEVEQVITVEIQNLASRSGKRLFLGVNINNQIKNVPEKLHDRKSPVVIRYGFYDSDSIVYHLPGGYSPEHVPAAVEINSRFGSYKSKLGISGNQITYVRELTMQKGTFPKETYDDLVEFFKQIVRADKQKVVFVYRQ